MGVRRRPNSLGFVEAGTQMLNHVQVGYGGVYCAPAHQMVERHIGVVS